MSVQVITQGLCRTTVRSDIATFLVFPVFFFLVGNLLRLQFEMIGRIVLEIQQYQSIGYPNAVDPLIRSQIQSWKVRLLFRWLCVLLVVQL